MQPAADVISSTYPGINDAKEKMEAREGGGERERERERERDEERERERAHFVSPLALSPGNQFAHFCAFCSEAEKERGGKEEEEEENGRVRETRQFRGGAISRIGRFFSVGIYCIYWTYCLEIGYPLFSLPTGNRLSASRRPGGRFLRGYVSARLGSGRT